MSHHGPRPLAICLFRRAGKILVAECHDRIKGEIFYRPLGGGIEFGEYAAQTIARELREEIGADVADIRFLFSLENIFVFNGQVGHEIVLVHDGTLSDQQLYQAEVVHGHEVSYPAIKAVWKPLADFEAGRLILYPEGLYERLNLEGPLAGSTRLGRAAN
jgi:8-oxo-dGTP pyrophosphatase MutT (NUDIX family)